MASPRYLSLCQVNTRVYLPMLDFVPNHSRLDHRYLDESPGFGKTSRLNLDPPGHGLNAELAQSVK